MICIIFNYSNRRVFGIDCICSRPFSFFYVSHRVNEMKTGVK